MIRNCFTGKFLQIQRSILIRYSSSDINLDNIKKLETDQVTEVIDDELRSKNEEIEKKRNKSRLKEYHRNMLNNEKPYSEPEFWHHGSIKYMRRLYGQYGAASGVDPALCWPIKEELKDAIEYEQIKYPYTIPELMKQAKLKRDEKNKRIMDRQRDIAKKIEKLEKWKIELHQKIEKKETEAMAAKMRRERLIEEVRRHFGYTVDPKDERFQELLEKKEKEQKKAMKEARKKAREEKAVNRILTKKDSSVNTQQVNEEKIE